MRVLATDRSSNVAILRVICDPCATDAAAHPEPGTTFRFRVLEGSDRACALCSKSDTLIS